MIPATEEDLDLFSSLRGRHAPRGCFIGDGVRVVRRMLRRTRVERILCAPEWLERLPVPEGIDVRVAPAERLHEIVGYNLHQGLMALARIPDPGPLKGSTLVALDGLDNAENVGAVLRCCAAFGVDGVIVGPGTASPWLRRAIRTSLGAPLQVPVHAVSDLPAVLRSLNAWAAHIHGERIDYRELDARGEVCLVLGGEANGVSAPVLASCRGTVYIPMAEGWDCLNVAASSAVLLAEVARQRKG